MAEVTVSDVRKSYGNVEVLHGVDIAIADGEFVVLVGPSGCGKSTLLRMVAGLEPITSGTIAIGERVVNQVPPKDRDIAMVFQSYALYPHKTVEQNMAFALKLRKTDPSVVRERVDTAAEILGLEPYLKRWAGLSCAIRRSSCSTSPCPTWMPSCGCRCARKSRNCTSG